MAVCASGAKEAALPFLRQGGKAAALHGILEDATLKGWRYI
jgi:hypothetical protein